MEILLDMYNEVHNDIFENSMEADDGEIVKEEDIRTEVTIKEDHRKLSRVSRTISI